MFSVHMLHSCDRHKLLKQLIPNVNYHFMDSGWTVYELQTCKRFSLFPKWWFREVYIQINVNIKWSIGLYDAVAVVDLYILLLLTRFPRQSKTYYRRYFTYHKNLQNISSWPCNLENPANSLQTLYLPQFPDKYHSDRNPANQIWWCHYQIPNTSSQCQQLYIIWDSLQMTKLPFLTNEM